ncbi:eukaryotic translation initiation factor 4 gamma 2 [Anthonomus grandis grandis]|uniref:eukaryotic translation initiation factor 4 gamma 2 n=1 Tax=Anthonomus grandis grandis TaxID=2921223 RepID=UPI002165DD87|nr:eukaryotic translation initiation factor 4 gamma 2 [Anthonomus grandis grandis]
MYAQLCKRLSEETPTFEQSDGTTITFRILLLNKCKTEFENRAAAVERNINGYAEDGTPLDREELEERHASAKRKMLGNIKFIGELGKLEILSESILHRCIKELLMRHGDDPSEDLECLCQIMRTCGRILDTEKGLYLMDQYFKRMQALAQNMDLQPRIRFMLKDIIDLRNDNWMPRKATVVEGPVPIAQIRPADNDRLGFRRDRNQERESDRNQSDSLFRHPLKTRGGLDDIMAGISFTSPAPLIPVGPPFGGPNGFGGREGRDGPFRNDRRGGSAYNNAGNYEGSRRGHYKHNQNNSGSNFSNQSNKEVAPRFKRNNLIVAKEELQEVELRPNSMPFNKSLVRNHNNMNGPVSMPLRASMMEPPSFGGGKQPPSAVKEPLPIKQLTQDRPKSKKDKGPSKEEVLKKFNTLLDEYWKGEVDLKQAINSYKEHKVPDKFAKDVTLSGLSLALDKSDAEQEKFIKLLGNLKEDGAVSGGAIQEAFKSLCHVLDQRETDVEGDKSAAVISAASVLLAAAVCEHLAPLSDVAVLTDNGAHYPLFLMVLQRVKKKTGKSELSEMFNKSKINLMAQLPESEKNKERLTEILEERELTFLYPLLRIQADLTRQLAADPNPQVFYKWLKENMETANFNDPGFINALVTVLIKYITQEAQSAGDEKAVAEKEVSILKRYQPILHEFLRDKSSLQLVAVYSLQMHFHAQGFPRGQLLRWFVSMYNLEIVDEEAFLNWKEDITDAYPGKQQALFQVNQWLTWLQETESDDEEGDD